MNRGGSTEAGTPKKEAATPATKSGRKVKRPAHFDDSPDRTKKSEAPAEVAKKSTRKTLIKPSQEDTPSKSNEHDESPEPVAVKKSARKTLLKDEPAKKSARKTKANDDSGKESSPEPESITQPKSARKALLKSAVKNASVEQDRDAGTPKAKKNNKPESEEEAAAGEAGVSRTGRKIKVPAHLKEFEDVVVPIAVKKEQTEVAPPRKSIAPVATKRDAPEAVAPKTPGRARSVARKATTEEEEERVAPKTPSRRAKSIAREPSEDPLAIEPEYEKPPAKTPKRAKSMAPEAKKSPETKEDNKPPTKTPVKRGRSMAPRADIVNTPEPAASKTPRASKLAAEDSGEPVSRSGRKIKPKKYFGEFEEEEPVAISAPVSKVASPVKASPKSSPVVKKDSPVKTVAKASPKVASPVKKIQSPVVTKVSPQPPKKDAEPKKSPSPVKRVIAAAGSASPQKKAKLELKPADPEKESKISPNTEERQITIRGHNDHHHTVETESVETVSDKDPLVGSSAETVITVTSDEQKQSPEPVAPKQQDEEKPKQRGGRKTLPAAPSEDETPKAPKTPARKTIMPTATASAVVEDAAGSSRSGRKIKPKKFFGDDEPEAAPVTKTPAAAASGRGKRKTIVADKKTPSPVAEPEQQPQPPVVQQPEAVTSREEILAIVGAVGVTAAPEEELLNLDIADSGLPSVLMAEAAQHDDLVSLEGQLESLIGSDHPPSNILAATQNEPAETNEEPEDTPVEDALDLVELLSQPSSQDLSEEPAQHQQEPVSEGNFPGTLIDQTAPAAAATAVEALPTEEPAVAPNDHVPLVENPPVEAQITAADEQVQAEQVVAEEAAPEPEAETTTTLENPTEIVQTAEVSASSNFSEALRVEEDAAEPPLLAEEEKPDELFESIEFLEDSSTTGEHAAEQANPIEATVPTEEPSSTPDIEEDLDKTEPPAMDDLGDEQDAATPLAANATFTADKDESITVLPSTPKSKAEKDEGVDLIGKSPTPHSSRTVVAVIEIPDTPLGGKQNLTPATPKTPEAKSSATAKDDFSPDKPDSQEEASVPQEIIEISDSPIVTLLEPSSSATIKRESATSTPLKHATTKKLTVQERLIQNSRKRSLSASDADVTKKNVTFHSPANSTILVDTIDERLKKSFKNGGSASKSAQRKRSLSEHKDSLKQDGPKPPKISKLPNFKSIHENHFNRMESIDEYHNRKVQRAKDVLANSTVKSPAASALLKTAERTTPHKASTAAAATTTVTKPVPVVPQLKFGQPPKADSSKLPSDEARQEKRQKQFQAAFKPKSAAATTAASSSSSDGTRRVVEQSRHKQHQILKGVRTNKRFELLMKFRDAQD